jgi:chemosensory pili system protein ChpA (sensor histidine kinase/response regulator)
MQRALLFSVVLTLVSPLAHADWDAALEAKEAAAREAEAQKQAAQAAEVQRLQAAAMSKFEAEQTQSMRQSLGAAAQGKSDAQVKALYDAQNKAAQAEGERVRQRLNDSSTAEGAAWKHSLGKTPQELQEMAAKDPAGYERYMQTQQAAQLQELKRGAAGQQLKAMTGASFEDMQNMSEEQLEALAKKMEQQYGQ